MAPLKSGEPCMREPTFGTTQVYALIVVEGTIYAGTGSGYLLAYTPGVDTDWRYLAAPYGGHELRSLVYYDGVIYAGTSDGYLMSYTIGESTEWTVVCSRFNDEPTIKALVELDGTIYGCTAGQGFLLSYTPGDSGWSIAANPYVPYKLINDMVVYNGTIYGGLTNGKIVKYTPGVSSSLELAADRVSGVGAATCLLVVGDTLYVASQYGHLLSWEIGSEEGLQIVAPQRMAVLDLAFYDNTIWAGANNGAYLLSYELEAPPTPPDTGGEALSLSSFWISPSQPRAGDTVAFKVSGTGITRARVTITVNNPFNGVNTTSHYMSLTGDTWWHKETYLHPCSVVATARVWGADGSSLNSTTLSFSVLPVEDEEPETPVEAVAEVVEEVSQAVEDWMISSIEVAGYEIPLWLPSLILLALSAGIWRRRR